MMTKKRIYYRGVEVVVTVAQRQQEPMKGRDGCTYYKYDVTIEYHPLKNDPYFYGIVGKKEEYQWPHRDNKEALNHAIMSAETLLDDIYEYQENRLMPQEEYAWKHFGESEIK